MKRGHQWIHMDAHFPLGLGHDLSERFGAAGQLVFVQFLCACKRSFPQGHIRYRTDDEACILLGVNFPLVDNSGDKWWLDDLWKWCSYRRVTTTSRRNGYRIVTASRWNQWEKSHALAMDAERKRRSRAQKRPENVRETSEASALEVGGGRLEVGGGSVRGERASTRPAGEAMQELINKLEPKRRKATGADG